MRLKARPTFADFVIDHEACPHCARDKAFGWHCALHRKAWVFEPGIKLYVRRVYRSRMFRPEGADFDLATLTATKPGNGALTRFLDRYEPQYGFFVENILEPRLALYLNRRGYLRWQREGQDPHRLDMFRPNKSVSFEHHDQGEHDAQDP